MSRHTAPGPAQEQAQRVIRHLLGGGELRSMAMVVAMLVGVGWLADSLYGWLTDIGNALEGQPVEDWFPLYRLIAVTAFFAVFLRLYQLAREARERYRPAVRSDPLPAQARGLILYLSNLRSEDAQRLGDALATIDDIQDVRDRFERLNWRMPLEAIAHHLPRLTHASLICSAGEGGSARQLGLFKELLARAFPQTTLNLTDAGDLVPAYRDGVDFEDVDQLADVTDQLHAHLQSLSLPPSDILIDITGGHKTTAVAGTAVALAEGRRIQYVSNRTYRVCVYDVTYEQ